MSKRNTKVGNGEHYTLRNTDFCNLANTVDKWSSTGVYNETDIKLSGEKQEMCIRFWQGNFCEGGKMAEHGDWVYYIKRNEICIQAVHSLIPC
jgi:hypothetical protein